eukprot:m.9794 g.9794  ORF g.9794 m.9794 type:complete len:251 (+) comp7000_c0_seq2:269-1021(+)
MSSRPSKIRKVARTDNNSEASAASMGSQTEHTRDTRITMRYLTLDGKQRGCVLQAYKCTSKGEFQLMFAEVLDLLQTREFALDLGKHITTVDPGHAVFWECPPVSRKTFKETAWECVVLSAQSLNDVKPNTVAFAEHFAKNDREDGIVSFTNLGGDTRLVAPCPHHKQGKTSNFAHLSAFILNAQSSQQAKFWAEFAVQMKQRLESAPSDDEPTWMSTAGQGVAWLHGRLDPKPKYYNYRLYARLAHTVL